MDHIFEIAAGGVLGADHAQSGRNSQDSYYILTRPDHIIAIACDGCSSGTDNEVGAKIGARLVAQSVSAQATSMISRVSQTSLSDVLTDAGFWERIRQDVLAQLRVLALQMGGSLSEVVERYFLFTVVGTLLTEHVSVFFALGDGVVFVNGTSHPLGPFPNNAPPYLGYGLVKTSQDFGAAGLSFKVVRALSTQYLQSFLIGTDGAEHLIVAEERTLPGKSDPVGPISKFWETDRFFQNPTWASRQLVLANREVVRPDWENRILGWEHGLLPDDTTVVFGRRRREEA